MNTEDTAPAHTYTPIELRCYFVRRRNALLVRGQFTDLFVDYYLHLAQHGIKLNQREDQMLKDGLTAMTLHLASRPWSEHHAWNIHFDNPVTNLFVCGDNNSSKVVGSVFSGPKREDGQSLMCSQMVKKGLSEPRSSTVNIPDTTFFEAVEHFYLQSEQRPGRLFELAEEDYIFIAAQPGCDVEWLQGLTAESLKSLDADEELSLLEKRLYHFECGCDIRRICDVLLPHCRNGVDGLFGEDDHIDVSCRRCSADYRILKEQLEAFLNEGN